MKTFISISALFLSLSLTAQTNPATWYLNDTSGNGIQSPSSIASGNSSFAVGNSTASGYGSIALLNASASGDESVAIGRTVMAEGKWSIAFGSGQAIASGDYSTSIGYTSNATGIMATAISRTTASGNSSTSMGYDTTASGDYSTAIGLNTTASDYNSLVVGRYNLLGSTLTNSATEFSLENTAFVIGNGSGWDSRSDALTVLFDGTTTIAGSVTATSFIGDGSQLTNLPSSSPFSYDENGGGIQSYSTATGKYSFAVGYGANSTNYYSIAMGSGATASGEASTAMGSGATASGNSSFAAAGHSEASGDYSIAMGCCAIASGSDAIALGHEVFSSGMSSFSVGNGSYASGGVSTAMGASTASGDYSTAMGIGTIASDNSSLVVGRFNSLGSTVTNSATDFSLENTAFVIGNGTYYDNRSDALTVLFDGTTTIAGDLSINSDARLKANIISLGSTLAKLLQIDGKTYTMKKDENKKQKIGLLAQDIEKVFPELVSESHGIKSVNYQGLVPVLINALKEQDAMMKEQESKYLKQEKRLERLEGLVAAMD